MRIKILTIVFALCISVAGQELKFFGEAKPGSVMIVKGNGIAGAWLNNQKLLIDKSGLFVFGFDRDAAGLQTLRVKFTDKTVRRFSYDLPEREYETQKLRIAPKYVNPPARELKRIKLETVKMKEARKKIGRSGKAFFAAGFAYPTDSVSITGLFGSRRVLNGQPKNIHNGLDFSAEEGDSIRAISDGIVCIAGVDFFYNGNFVLLDHGQGLNSVYLHMSRLLVKNNQTVKKGEVIGLAGSTGRATGPHLHLGLQWFNKRIDPLSVLEMKFPKELKGRR
jgi:murein DD-endopeptidase MepM/ murein hydrolase activator NlpD